MFYNVFLLIHVLIAISLVVLVILQQGRGADAGAAFGSGASATVFGAQGSASFLSRTTAMLATGFFVTSLVLGYFATQSVAPSSVMENLTEEDITLVEESQNSTLDVPTVGSDANEASNDASEETASTETAQASEETADETSSGADSRSVSEPDDVPAPVAGEAADVQADSNSEEATAPADDVPAAPDTGSNEQGS